MIVTSNTDGLSQCPLFKTVTYRSPPTEVCWTRPIPAIAGEQHPNEQATSQLIIASQLHPKCDANHTSKQPCTSAVKYAYKPLCFVVLYYSNMHIHAHKHTATLSAAKASNWPDSDSFWSLRFDKQATNKYPLYSIRQNENCKHPFTPRASNVIILFVHSWSHHYQHPWASRTLSNAPPTSRFC